MPGTNLTRDEAHTRAALIEVGSYTIELDLTTGDTTFASTTTIEFDCREPGAETFAELVDATIHEITLNRTALDPAQVYGPFANEELALSTDGAGEQQHGDVTAQERGQQHEEAVDRSQHQRRRG